MSNYGRPIPPTMLNGIWDRRVDDLDFDYFDEHGYGYGSTTDLVGPGRWSWVTTPAGDHAGVVWTNDHDVTSVLFERRSDFDPVAYGAVVLSLRKAFEQRLSAPDAFDRTPYCVRCPKGRQRRSQRPLRREVR